MPDASRSHAAPATWRGWQVSWHGEVYAQVLLESASDLARLDSVSGRVQWMPTPRVVMQVSSGLLREAEAEFPPEPRSDLRRTTASILYVHDVKPGQELAVTAAYGVNAGHEVVPGAVAHLRTHAALVEGALRVGNRHTWSARVELVGKAGHDLHAHEYATRVFPVGKAHVGYARRVATARGVAASVGGFLSLALLPPDLAPRYFGSVAPGVGVFVRLSPGSHD